MVPGTEGSASPSAGPGSATEIEEETLWEGRVSAKIFLGRMICGGVLLLAALALATAKWMFGYTTLTFLTYFVGAVTVIYVLAFAFNIFRARRKHLLPSHVRAGCS